MASITSTTTTTTTRQDRLPNDQQSLVFRNVRDLNVLLSIRGDVSEEEQEEIDAIELWSLLDEGEKNRVSYFLNTEKNWIVIDWVTGHFDDNRLGFTEQKGTGKLIPNIIRQQLMKQQYGNSSSSNVMFLDFEGRDSDLDIPELQIKQFMTGELNIGPISEEQLYKALKEVMLYHGTTAKIKEQRIYMDLLKCFSNPTLFVTLNKKDHQLSFLFRSNIVQEMLITKKKIKDGVYNWSITIRHSLGLSYDTNVLNLYFVIMDKQHYNTNNKNIKDALNTCYQGERLNNKLIKLVSGNQVESKKLSKKIKKIIDKDGMDEQQVKKGSFKTSFNIHQLRVQVLKQLKNKKVGLTKKRSKEGDRTKSSKKTKKRKQGDENTGATVEDPIDLTLMKIQLKF